MSRKYKKQITKESERTIKLYMTADRNTQFLKIKLFLHFIMK